MANWKTVLDIKDEWKKAGENKITIQNLVNVIIDRLKELQQSFSDDDELNDIIEKFGDFVVYENDGLYDFDDIMDELYNWGDNDHTCWIKTF